MSHDKRNHDNWNDSQAESPSVDCPVCSACIDLPTAEIITAPSVAACCPECGALASLLPDDPRAYEPAGYDPNPEGDLPF